VETVRFLGGILTRTDSHLDERMTMLRRLAIADLK
jgi:hypothetical protein